MRLLYLERCIQINSVLNNGHASVAEKGWMSWGQTKTDTSDSSPGLNS